MEWLRTLFAELNIALTGPTVWVSIGQTLLFAFVAWLLGFWIARAIGLLAADAPRGETVGVGLASGLLILASWSAAWVSGGRSSFTPVAIGFLLAVVTCVARRVWRTSRGGSISPSSSQDGNTMAGLPRVDRRRAVPAALASAAFIMGIGLLYGATIAPGPRAGVQPVEFADEAYYSVLGADLASTGTESVYSPSGLAELKNLPLQTWYHWGELWLAALAINLFGATPMVARHYFVLPLLLLAAAAMTGTIVRRVTRSATTGAFLFGFFACLVLAPVPLMAGPFFSSWAVGMVFGVVVYGLSAVAVLVSIYFIAVFDGRDSDWALAIFAGSAIALILPAHVVVAFLAAVGVAGAWSFMALRAMHSGHRLPIVPSIWRRTLAVAGLVTVATLGWGLITGHGFGGLGVSPSVSPFNASWRESILIILVGAGALLMIPIAWNLADQDSPREADLYVGTMVLLVVGALAWGARLGDYNMFHVFFGGIAVFATPMAAIAVWSVWLRFRRSGRRLIALAVLLICFTQMEFGLGLGIIRLQGFGPDDYPPVPVGILDAIRALPVGAKLAYACQPGEEFAFWEGRLISLDAHTSRRVVPMCFQAESLGRHTGAEMSLQVPSPLFLAAPQRDLYPTANATPSAASVIAFLKTQDIDYVYADARHPNSIAPGATQIAAFGDFQLLRVP